MKHRLLVVDDQEAILFGVRRYFEAEGFVIDCASELEEAQALVRNRRYDLVIADLRLTGVHGSEGLELIRFLRTHSPWSKSILLTAYGNKDLEGEAYARGVDVVIRKPQPLATLAQVVYTLLADGEPMDSGPAGGSEG